MTTYGYRRDDGEEITEGDLRDMYDNMLDDLYGHAQVAGCEYSTSWALQELDPIAYQVGMSEYWGFLLEDGDYVESYEETYAYEEEVDAEDDDEDDED